MQFDAFGLRLLFLALPGILALKAYRKLRGPTKKEAWESFIEVLLFSLLAYLVLGLIQQTLGVKATNTPILMSPGAAPGSTTRQYYEPYPVQAVFDPNMPLDWLQIAWACMIALGLAAAASAIHNNGVVTWLGRKARLTQRVADEDVWELFLNSPIPRWVLVRDHKHALAYFGLARYYSDSGSDRELVLEKVDVYNNDSGEKLYGTNGVYLSLDKADVSIEIPKEEKNSQ